MPPISPATLRAQAMALLDRVGAALVPTARVVGYLGLAVLIVTGEAIRWVDYRDTLISAPLLRATHALGGFLLLASLLVRVGDPLVQGVVRRLRAVRDGTRRPAFNRQAPDWVGRSLDAAWWGVVGLLVLSGLERYAQLRHGVSLLPWLPPTAWWAMHRPLLPYLYAILLSNVLIRGRILVRQALHYLYTP